MALTPGSGGSPSSSRYSRGGSYYIPGYGNAGDPNTDWSRPTKANYSQSDEYVANNPNTFRINSSGQLAGQQPPPQVWGSTSSGGGGGYGYGGGGGGGGGGGAASHAGLDQETAMMLAGLVGGSGPSWNTPGVDLNRLNVRGPDLGKFREWNPERFTRLASRGRKAAKGAKKSSRKAYDQAASEMKRQPNAFAGKNARVSQSPGTSKHIREMMQAQGGAGRSGAGGARRESQQADRAFSNFVDLMAGSEQQRMQGDRRALQGDARRAGENLSREQRDLMTQIQFARGSARDQYDQDRFGFQTQKKLGNYQHRMQMGQANNQIANQQQMLNWQRANNRDTERNTWRQGIINPITQMMMAGMKDGGQTLDVDEILERLGL